MEVMAKMTERTFTTRLVWSVDEGQWVATVDEHESLSFFADNASAAFEGLATILLHVLRDGESALPLKEVLDEELQRADAQDRPVFVLTEYREYRSVHSTRAGAEKARDDYLTECKRQWEADTTGHWGHGVGPWQAPDLGIVEVTLGE